MPVKDLLNMARQFIFFLPGNNKSAYNHSRGISIFNTRFIAINIICSFHIVHCLPDSLDNQRHITYFAFFYPASVKPLNKLVLVPPRTLRLFKRSSARNQACLTPALWLKGGDPRVRRAPGTSFLY